jgi:hypothetical protein
VKIARTTTGAVPTAERPELRCSVWQLVAIACFVSLYIGFFDVIVTLILRPGELTSTFMSLHLAFAGAAVLVAYLGL